MSNGFVKSSVFILTPFSRRLLTFYCKSARSFYNKNLCKCWFKQCFTDTQWTKYLLKEMQHTSKVTQTFPCCWFLIQMKIRHQKHRFKAASSFLQTCRRIRCTKWEAIKWNSNQKLLKDASANFLTRTELRSV